MVSAPDALTKLLGPVHECHCVILGGLCCEPESQNMVGPVTNIWTLRSSGSRGEERVAGGASRTARLQYLSALQARGRQPRNRHDVDDPLLLAPQKERTSNLLWVLVFLLLPQQSAHWTPQRQKMAAADKWPLVTQ